MSGLKCPEHADAVDERIDLEMHAQTEQHAGKADIS